MQNKKKKSVKKEKGAISTLVLFTILIFLAILMGSYLITTTLLKSQLRSNLRIQQIYGQEVDNVDEIYQEIVLQRVANSKNIYFEKETILLDSNDNKIVVPKGFKIAEDSGNNVTEGIVIEDDDIQTDGNGDKRGNQYVWIPVSNINKDGSNLIKKSNEEGKTEEIEITLGRYEFADGTSTYKDNNESNLGVLAKGKEILRQKGEEYSKTITIDSYYQELSTYREGNEVEDLTGENRTAKELKEFIDSVQKNRGYYIARYEASYGTDGRANSKVSNGFNDNTTAPSVEGYLWNNITQIKAAEACDSLYTTVQSDLVNSYAWDTAIVYIQKFSKETAYSRQISKNTTSLANTGERENDTTDKVCNIYDMASNCVEWTTEYSTNIPSSLTGPCVCRGGYYADKYRYMNFRDDGDVTSNSKYGTFRPILYIK